MREQSQLKCTQLISPLCPIRVCIRLQWHIQPNKYILKIFHRTFVKWLSRIWNGYANFPFSTIQVQAENVQNSEWILRTLIAGSHTPPWWHIPQCECVIKRPSDQTISDRVEGERDYLSRMTLSQYERQKGKQKGKWEISHYSTPRTKTEHVEYLRTDYSHA